MSPPTSVLWTDGFFFDYICPTLGGLIASTLFAAPINDIRAALQNGSLGPLNPIPWAIMTGNCLGWCAYSYYTHDPFILAANLPGFILSLWLNMGAMKLQYLAHFDYTRSLLSSTTTTTTTTSTRTHRPVAGLALTSPNNNNNNNNNNTIRNKVDDRLVHSSQDIILLRILSLWAVVLVFVGWLDVPFVQDHQAQTIGLVVNINLIFFYGAPLQTVQLVLQTRRSDSLHSPTVILNCLNATFWMLYGIARNDVVVYVPNGIGLLLGLIQLLLVMSYPKSSSTGRTCCRRRGRSDDDDDDVSGQGSILTMRRKTRADIEFRPVHADADPDYSDNDDDDYGDDHDHDDNIRPEMAHPIPPTL